MSAFGRPKKSEKQREEDANEAAWAKLEQDRIEAVRKQAALDAALGRQAVERVGWRPEGLVSVFQKKIAPPKAEKAGTARMRRWREKNLERSRDADRRYRANNREFYNQRKAEIMRLRRRLKAERKAALKAKNAS